MRRADGGGSGVAARGRDEARARVEAFRARGHLLTDEERALLDMVLERGNSLRQIARLSGLTHPRLLRRVRSLLRRLGDDTYEICLGNRDDFNGRELGIIRDFFIAGRSCRAISRTRDVSRHYVHRTLAKARRYAASVKAPPKPIDTTRR